MGVKGSKIQYGPAGAIEGIRRLWMDLDKFVEGFGRLAALNPTVLTYMDDFVIKMTRSGLIPPESEPLCVRADGILRVYVCAEEKATIADQAQFHPGSLPDDMRAVLNGFSCVVLICWLSVVLGSEGCKCNNLEYFSCGSSPYGRYECTDCNPPMCSNVGNQNCLVCANNPSQCLLSPCDAPVPRSADCFQSSSCSCPVPPYPVSSCCATCYSSNPSSPCTCSTGNFPGLGFNVGSKEYLPSFTGQLGNGGSQAITKAVVWTDGSTYVKSYYINIHCVDCRDWDSCDVYSSISVGSSVIWRSTSVTLAGGKGTLELINLPNPSFVGSTSYTLSVVVVSHNGGIIPIGSHWYEVDMVLGRLAWLPSPPSPPPASIPIAPPRPPINPPTANPIVSPSLIPSPAPIWSPPNTVPWSQSTNPPNKALPMPIWAIVLIAVLAVLLLVVVAVLAFKWSSSLATDVQHKRLPQLAEESAPLIQVVD